MNEWHDVNELLPPFEMEVEIPGAGENIFIASLFDRLRGLPNGNMTRFIYHDERIEGIEFCYPQKWRFKK